MIPRSEIEVRQRVDLDALNAPGAGTVEYPGWLGVQRDYDPDIYADADWGRAEEELEAERRALREASAVAACDSEFDEVAYEHFEAGAPLELGVAALCLALNAAGCVTAYSCRGHPDPPSYPQVLLASDRARAAVLVELCAETGCGLENFEERGLAIYAASVAEFIDLAAAICRECARFPARAF